MYIKKLLRAYYRRTVSLASFSAFILFIVFSLSSPLFAAEKVFHILTLNDVHSRIFPCYDAPAAGLGPEVKGVPIGGLSRALFLMKEEERKIEAASQGAVFKLEAGDMPVPNSALPNEDEGVFKALALFGFDAGVLGNHEFDSGVDYLAKLMQSVKFPILASNVVFDNPKTSSLFEKEIIIEKEGVKVGIFGLVTPFLPSLVIDASGFQVSADLKEAASKHISSLKSRGADVIIALTHIGLGADKELAASVSGIDIIVGGHSHDAAEQKILIKNPSGRMTLVTQAGQDGCFIGRIDAVSDENGIIADKTSWTLIPVTPATPELKEIVTLVEKISPKQSSKEADVCFTVSVDGRFSVLRTRECAFGNFTADALRAWGGTDAAFANGGGIRMGRIVPAGPFSRLDMAACFPFKNYVEKVYLSGAEIRRTLEKSASALKASGETMDYSKRPHSGEFMQVSGLRFTINLSKTPAVVVNNIVLETGNRVSDVEILRKGIWEPLDDDKIYTAAMADFIAQSLSPICASKSGKVILDVIKEYAATVPERKIELREKNERITIIETAETK